MQIAQMNAMKGVRKIHPIIAQNILRRLPQVIRNVKTKNKQ